MSILNNQLIRPPEGKLLGFPTTEIRTATQPSFPPVHFNAGRAERTARDSTGAGKSTGIPDRPSVAKRSHGSSFECIYNIASAN